ncbi:unnamed protein product [Moneuplotes crassus]|uniref:Uncharacterized protein n=1 Tax=Euplotes crassus TaxID=5936 RepID=A0AAD1XXA1_EUPCR|nr:unnamed protein product [Moneuplotes crassus]
MFRGKSVRIPGRDGQIKVLENKIKKLENEYGTLAEFESNYTYAPNPTVCDSTVEFIDSKLLLDPIVMNSLFSKGEMKSALKKKYKDKLLVLSKDNNPSKAYAKEEDDDDDDEDEDEPITDMKKSNQGKPKLIEKPDVQEHSNKTCCIIQ